MAPLQDGPVLIPLERELEERLAWFIGMRWLAGAGILLGTFLTSHWLLQALPASALYAVGGLVLAYNLFFFLARPHMESSPLALRRFVFAQIGLDWFALLTLVHFTGGLRSPITLAFTFHLIISAILLSQQACYLLAGSASLMLGVLTLFEEHGFLPPPNLDLLYVSAPDALLSSFKLWVAITLFLFVTAYLATSITAKLRSKEQALFHSERALGQSYHDMESLYHLGQVVNSTLDMKEVLQLIAENATRLLGMKACFIRLLDASGTLLYIGGAFGISQSYLNKGPVQVEKSLVDLEALRGGVVQVLEVASDARFQYREEARLEGLRSMLCVPVQAKSRVLGVIRVYSGEPHRFSEQEQSLLRNLANLGAVAIGNARSYAELQSLNEEKVWFARMTHHQLRSPLAAIHGTLDALPFAGPLNEKQTELVERAQRRIQDAFVTIRDFLDLAAAQRPREMAHPRAVELSAALKRTLEAVVETAQAKHVDFVTEFGRDAVVYAEPADLDRIFSNLLDNAVKYTPSGGTVRFTIERSRSGEVKAIVRDTGIGIPEGEQERIFEGFYRTREAKASGEIGTGLGLSIVKKLTERLGARLELHSTPGEGTEFRVIFPRFDTSAGETAAVQGSEVGLAGS